MLFRSVITLAEKSKIPEAEQVRYGAGRNQKFKNEVKKTWKNWKQSLDNFKFNEALISIWDLISFCDRYIEKERPWEESENQKEVISNLLLALSEIAKLLEPFLPEAAEKILEQIKTKKSQPLFPRI